MVLQRLSQMTFAFDKEANPCHSTFTDNEGNEKYVIKLRFRQGSFFIVFIF
jgi:hypothetical protein